MRALILPQNTTMRYRASQTAHQRTERSNIQYQNSDSKEGSVNGSADPSDIYQRLARLGLIWVGSSRYSVCDTKYASNCNGEAFNSHNFPAADYMSCLTQLIVRHRTYLSLLGR